MKLKWKAPKKFYKKKYFVKAVCDSGNSIDEANEDNNITASRGKVKIVK